MTVRGVQVESKNRLKIDQKMKSTWEGILASIFHRFWWILETKLDPSWHQKSNKNGYKKPSKKEAPKKASWNPKKRDLGGQEAPKRPPRGPQHKWLGYIYIYAHSWLPPPEPRSLSSKKTDDGLKALLQAALRSYLPRFPPYI